MPVVHVIFGKKSVGWLGLLGTLSLLLTSCAEPTRPAPGEAGPIFSADSSAVRVAAGAHYARRGWLWQRLWGRHYRPLWATPVSAPVLRLGALGLTPLRAGGSFQTNTLRLRSPDGREFVLRSVDKDLSQTVGSGWLARLVSPVLRDQTCAAPPYGAYVATVLARAAGVFHTNPRLVYLLPDAALGEWRRRFAPTLYLLEERPDHDQRHASSFGNARRVVGSDSMLTQVLRGPASHLDPRAYLRARLLDLLLGDWSRRADQWRWAAFAEAGSTAFRPIPRDRDQAFFRFDDGWLTRVVAWVHPRYQTFNAHLEPADVGPLTTTARPLDHTALALLSEADFRAEADSLRRRLPDAVLAQTLLAVPAEVRPGLTQELLPALRARRDALPAVASQYYKVLQENAVVVGTDAAERFELTGLGPGQLRLRVFARRPTRPDSLLGEQVYDVHRTICLRVYGLGGKDEFALNGRLAPGFGVHLYGGAGRNVFLQDAILQAAGPGFTIHPGPDADLVQASHTVRVVPGSTAPATAAAWVASQYRLRLGQKIER
ncbi:hypothetical protein GKZ68_02080 [Hymenobacter sp. BRD128]|uniref:hypothetical protein n=1 Tax=Hymenobacter sp. BRD128 TaxID=2675878 RepID=UPI0015664DEB|nr:hypothetical protein [Hymenobacter sp. BRD128]QKG55533.1 hypothetical protein GKZ68_02080 [Hymenobacter sp. BRD128]